jgi:dihydropyrimidine dehydrogenase (NAD+) subunit PreA
MSDISVEFCGIIFTNPFVLPSAQSVRTREMILRAFDTGWGGAVTQTLFWDVRRIENVRPRLHVYKENGSVIGVMNIELVTMRPLDEWLEDIVAIKQVYPDRPIIASIMGEGDKSDQWVEMANMCAQAGADALELNLSCPHGMPEIGTGAFIGQNADLASMVTSWVVNTTKLPVIVKLTPNVTDIVAIARSAYEAGASGITAINNLNSLAGVDIDRLEPLPSVNGYTSFGGYAGPGLKPVALRCVAEIAKAIPGIPISGTGGIETWSDAVEYFFVGASLAQIYTVVMKEGYSVINELIVGLADYMERMEFESVKDMVGIVLNKIVAHNDLSRHKVFADFDQDLCIKCGKCFLACEDSGFQAITIGTLGYPEIDENVCDGCGLCVALCPIEGCMYST